MSERNYRSLRSRLWKRESPPTPSDEVGGGDYQREYYGANVRAGNEHYENPGLGHQYGSRAYSRNPLPVESDAKAEG